MPSNVRVRNSLLPGDLGAVVRLHGLLYSTEFGLDHTFEGYVASGLGEFAKLYDARKDFWAIAEIDERILGSIAIVAQPDQTAQLRWFLIDPELRGQGVGHRLLSQAIEFCRSHHFKSVYLWTVSELKVAGHLYRQAGFVLTEQVTHDIWGSVRTEERYDLIL